MKALASLDVLFVLSMLGCLVMSLQFFDHNLLSISDKKLNS